jgi:pyrroloquinoline-quinone synthase
MNRNRTATLVRDAVGDHRLLRHPFYQRWEAGELQPVELGHYAEQYRHVEVALPGVLATVAASLEAGPVRELVEENLADERGMPTAHVDMFELFAARTGARPSADASPATARLVQLQAEAARRSPQDGIAALAAYECQAADIARSKAEGLRRHYGMDAVGTWFWDVHGALEDRHADWSFEALARLGADESGLTDTVTATARAWWEFLDEREAAAAA